MIANSAAMNHDPGGRGAKFFMRGIMTKGQDVEKPLSLVTSADTENSGAKHIARSLAAEITAEFGPRDETALSIVAYTGDIAVGGLNGSTHWGWCYIRHLWVQPDRQRQGLGRRLLAEAETEARARHCIGLYVDTFNPGAAAFYERSGFERFGRIDNFPPGHARIFLRKRLIS
jgi:ribosomal protein S18 acetylase RimI-like enzyme